METDITKAALSGKKNISAALFARRFHYLLGPRIRRPAIRYYVRKIANRIKICDNTRIVLALSSAVSPQSADLAVRYIHLHLLPQAGTGCSECIQIPQSQPNRADLL